MAKRLHHHRAEGLFFLSLLLFWVMTGDWELRFPGPVIGSGGFWPLCYTHPVLSEKLKKLLRSIHPIFCVISFHLSSSPCGCIVLFRHLLLWTYIWVCGNEKLCAQSHITYVVLLEWIIGWTRCLCTHKPASKTWSSGCLIRSWRWDIQTGLTERPDIHTIKCPWSVSPF